jgi:hypothetical protein
MKTMEKNQESKSIALDIPFPEADHRRLNVAVGACRLITRPGRSMSDAEWTEDAAGMEQAGRWVTGLYYGPIEALPLQISQENGTVRISQRQEWEEVVRLLESKPTLDLTLGKAMPYELDVDTGASDTYLDLGGLPLTELNLKQGAGRFVVDFTAPNPAELNRIHLGSGASSIEMMSLANSNAGELKIEGGAASYKLDFQGMLRRPMHVKISAAMSAVDLVIPASTPARITYRPVMGGANIGDGFLKKDGAYWTESATADLQPMLSIEVTLTMGSLNLHSM